MDNVLGDENILCSCGSLAINANEEWSFLWFSVEIGQIFHLSMAPFRTAKVEHNWIVFGFTAFKSRSNKNIETNWSSQIWSFVFEFAAAQKRGETD